ncbi:MAG: DNA mismatch repair protein MutS [Deltaproteobacteria bacterium]|nr:DNA mismatch repair protein MutS [Deltaproteobacteria bacterium]
MIRERQAAVEELRPRLDLREDLAALGDAVRAGLHADALRRWGEAPALLRSGGWRWAAAGLPTVSVVSLAAWVSGLSGPAFFELALVVQALFALLLRSRVMRVVRAADLPARDLALLAELLARIEAERFEAPALLRLRAALDTEGVPPSRRTADLRLRIDLLDARRNQLFVPIGALLLWTTQLAFAIERWRAACGPALARWIAALGEIEALAALAAVAYENPDHTFPEIEAEGDVFEAEALGHPLLPASCCVRNDLCLGEGLRVLVVSGSNMSGKSTLLRTVGTNAVLALAGAPVRARRMRIGPLVLGASICLQDSLLEGRSRFYAEIGRLRSLVELAEGRQTLLFLIDEILHGTNSHDRGVGAEAIIRGLVERGALGLVTTHDLALAKVADALAPRAANVHFEDHLEDGEIAFDYRMRPGVVEKSNALELMRSVGLDV